MYRVFVAVMLWLVVAGCSKVVPGQQESGVPISVVPVVQSVKSVKSDGTKALINGAAELQQYPISLFGTATKDAFSSDVFNNEVLSYSSDQWSYSNGTRYWIPGALYSFAAVCPYVVLEGGTKPQSVDIVLSNGSASYSNAQVTIQDYNTGRSNDFDARCEDLLYYAFERDNTSNNDYSTVQLQMEHFLACLEFNVRNATNNPITKISDISLTGHNYKCTLQVSANACVLIPDISTVGGNEQYFAGEDRVAQSNASNFLPAGMAQDSWKHLYDCDYLTVLPQTVYGKHILLTFTVHYGAESAATYYLNLSGIESVVKWDAGKKYSYNLTITSKDIYFQVSEVPWVTHDVLLK